jgi:hypothetical protein
MPEKITTIKRICQSGEIAEAKMNRSRVRALSVFVGRLPPPEKWRSSFRDLWALLN